MKPCWGPILRPIPLPSIIRVEPGDLSSILPTLYAHIYLGALCTCSLPNPHPPPTSKVFSLINIVGLIYFHYLHFMWSMSCSRITLATSPLPVIFCHITLSYILPGLLIILNYHIYIFSYYPSFPINMFYETENVFSWFSILLPENSLSPIPWKIHHAYSLDKGLAEWVVKEIMPLWGLLCTTASKQL